MTYSEKWKVSISPMPLKGWHVHPTKKDDDDDFVVGRAPAIPIAIRNWDTEGWRSLFGRSYEYPTTKRRLDKAIKKCQAFCDTANRNEAYAEGVVSELGT